MKRSISLFCSLILLGSCAPEPEPWYAQLKADSPCYRVDLMDGLDEATTVEVQDLFSCLNHHGHFQALAPTMAAAETNSPSGVPAAIELAKAVNAMPDADVDIFAILDLTVDLIESDEPVLEHTFDVVLELIYGENYALVRRDGYDLGHAGKLQAGVLVPMAPVIPEVASALLRDDMQTAALIGDVLQDPDTHRWIWTMAAWADSTHPDVERPLNAMLPHLGEALVSTTDASNDHWNAASGDSLRDLADAFTAGSPDLVERTGPELNSILSDPVIRREIQELLVDLESQGHLQQTMQQATWLAYVDAQGGYLSPGETSGLQALLRLMAETNRPARCSIDLWFTVVNIDLGNLSVALLRTMADWDPDNVQTGAALAGTVLGYSFSDNLLTTVAESGVCPALTLQVVRDLPSLDLLGEPQARSLTHTMVGMLKVSKYGKKDHIPEVVDLISDVHSGGGVLPLQEVLRDLGENEINADLTKLVPVMAHPWRYDIDAQGDRAANLEDLLDVVTWLVHPKDGKTGYQRLKPLLQPALEHDGTWQAIHHASTVLADQNSRLAQAHELLPPMIAADPELKILQQIGPMLSERAIAEPILRIAATSAVTDKLMASRGDVEHPEVPLAFAGRLIAHGALDDLLNIMRIVLHDVRNMDTDEQ
ncbi:MAG: hypothetical protein ACI9MC_002202 [Kiritimatiellia bacterium]|jgi:hypothetical protein